MLFMVHKQMSVDRSLKLLAETVRAMGVRISDKTLERYSAEYHWQEQILQQNAKEHEQQEKSILAQVDQMNDADAQLARGFRAFVVAAINRVRDNMRIDQAARQKNMAPGQTAPMFLDMTFQEMESMARTAQQMERLARGQATSRTEVWIEVVTTVVQEFALIFIGVNKIKDEEERMNEYARLSDEIITRYYSNTVRQGVDIAKRSNG